MITGSGLVSLKETAAMLSVSSATVRNWIKHEYLRPANRSGGMVFRYEEVRNLRENILRGSVRRLASRANKATASRSFIPEEYIGGRESREGIEKIVACIGGLGLDIRKAFFTLAVSRICSEGLNGPSDAERFAASGFRVPGMGRLSEELRSWRRELGNFNLTGKYAELLSFNLPQQRDALGLIYQSLLREGDKAARGSYYTPGAVVDAIVFSSMAEGARVLDPCCGTGQFLLAFAEKAGDPRNLHGCDIDALAVRIARINVMMRFPGLDFEPRIYRSNVLTGEGFDIGGGFDVVATNPPWGLHFGREDLSLLKSLYPQIRAPESFSYILLKSIDLLRDGGFLSFILPESILNVKSHGDIRRAVLERARIERIIRLGRIFRNVFTPVIRLDLTKGARPGRMRYVSEGRARSIDQRRFMLNGDCVFDINVGGMDCRIMEKIQGGEHITLEGKADWALGIVTGNNKRYLLPDGTTPGSEPIYMGRDVSPYFLKRPSNYIRYDSGRFQQSAPECRYRATEKLVYRFISKKLIVAYDDRGSLTLNSANILIPRLDDYPVKAVLALFNSSPYQFIFQKKFSSIKVLRGHLEQLPLPLWDRRSMARMVSLADSVLAGTACLDDVDDFIMERFGLTAAERDHIIKSII
ncbi:MAG: N-6 DNA methylase [Spirochaetes bacterium]|nr:N-6 DNA methylase [Spirochaetota bacterium]